jgi:HD-GYP domain-containing protein (c-di-GMP phosphodiesterase class II)
LTAGDRPYKKSISTEAALDILRHEQRAGHVDGALLTLFVEARIYEQASAPAVNPTGADRRSPTR